MHWFEKIANRQIDAAEARGELRGLAGEGKPLDPERLRETADDVLHRLMADGGYLPPEIEIAKEVAAMRAAFAQIEDEDERRALQRRIAMAELKQNIATDARRRFMR